MARAHLRQAAHQQAAAEYNPQRQRVRRERRSQVRSLRSEEPALIGAIELAEKQLRHAGLSGRDLAIAESELAHRTADVGASTTLQIDQARRSAGEQLVDLSQSQGQAEKGILSTLLNEAAQRKYEEQKEEKGDVRDFKLGIEKAQILHQLGLTSEGGTASSGGLTPTQQRAAAADHANAAHYAKEYVQAARHGLTDEKSGKQILPPGPHNWDDQQWNLFVDKVSKVAGVDVPVAERAVGAVRAHFQPGTGAPKTPIQALAAAAGTAAANPLQALPAIAQALLHHR